MQWLASLILTIKPSSQCCQQLASSFPEISFFAWMAMIFFNKHNFWWETNLELLQIEQRKAFKKSLNFSPNLQKFFSEKVSAGPIGFLAKYENVKGISKIHLSLFRHFAAFFLLKPKTKKFSKGETITEASVSTFFKWNSFFVL